MYAIGDVTTTIDSNLGWVMLWTLIAWTGGFVQILEGVRLSRRDKMLGMPIGIVIFLLAHDSTYALRYDFWLNTVDHWYFSVFVIGMILSIPIELYLLYIFVSTAPDEPPRTYLIPVVLLFVVTTYLLLWGAQAMMPGDPLFLVTLASTNVAAVVFNIPMLLIRGNTQGQSRLFAWASLLGPGSLSLGLFPALSPLFRNALFGGLCLCLTSLSALYIALFEHYRRSETLREQV